MENLSEFSSNIPILCVDKMGSDDLINSLRNKYYKNLFSTIEIEV